jgi:transcriptional regulator with XRE-family HTH domain
VSVADRMKAAREERGWSQAELAEAAGLPPAAVSRYESGKYEPSVASLRKLLDALGCSADWLLEHEVPG